VGEKVRHRAGAAHQRLQYSRAPASKRSLFAGGRTASAVERSWVPSSWHREGKWLAAGPRSRALTTGDEDGPVPLDVSGEDGQGRWRAQRSTSAPCPFDGAAGAPARAPPAAAPAPPFHQELLLFVADWPCLSTVPSAAAGNIISDLQSHVPSSPPSYNARLRHVITTTAAVSWTPATVHLRRQRHRRLRVPSPLTADVPGRSEQRPGVPAASELVARRGPSRGGGGRMLAPLEAPAPAAARGGRRRAPQQSHAGLSISS
jgi:hypothetical protein